MKEISTTTCLALYGAGLSTLIALCSWFRALSDKGKLRVHCYVGQIVMPGGMTDSNRYLVYSVTNIGRRPIYAASYGGSIRTDSEFSDFFIPGGTQRLEPGETTTIQTTDFSAIDSNLKALWVKDTLGKAWCADRKTKKALVRRVLEIRKEES
jgi:hypothetical protein